METIDERTCKEKWRDFKGRCKQKWEDFKWWVYDHRQLVAAVLSVLIPVAVSGAKEIHKERRKDADMREKQTRIYDPVQGQYFFLKKPLNKTQKLEFERRKTNGEPTGKILTSMGIKFK